MSRLPTRPLGRRGLVDNKACFEVSGGGVACFQLLLHQGVAFSNIRTDSKSGGGAKKSIAKPGSARTDAGAALAVAAKARNVMEVHRILEHPSEDITRKVAEAMGITTTSQWRSRVACL